MGMNKPKWPSDRLYGHLTGLAAVLGMAGPVAAQTEPGAAAESDSLAEIVVTAEKRDSTVQKTPISITAISGADLEAAGVSSFSTVASETPGISIRSAGPGQNEIEMRGLTSSGGAAPTVGFYLDEVPLSPPAGANNGKVVIDPDLYDLDRVEALRGPQGTLYGSGSMGGTVKLVTAQPKLDEWQRQRGALRLPHARRERQWLGQLHDQSVPIVNDAVALRIVGTELHESGMDRPHRARQLSARAGLQPDAAARHGHHAAAGQCSNLARASRLITT